MDFLLRQKKKTKMKSYLAILCMYVSTSLVYSENDSRFSCPTSSMKTFTTPMKMVKKEEGESKLVDLRGFGRIFKIEWASSVQLGGLIFTRIEGDCRALSVLLDLDTPKSDDLEIISCPTIDLEKNKENHLRHEWIESARIWSGKMMVRDAENEIETDIVDDDDENVNLIRQIDLKTNHGNTYTCSAISNEPVQKKSKNEMDLLDPDDIFEKRIEFEENDVDIDQFLTGFLLNVDADTGIIQVMGLEFAQIEAEKADKSKNENMNRHIHSIMEMSSKMSRKWVDILLTGHTKYALGLTMSLIICLSVIACVFANEVKEKDEENWRYVRIK